MRIGLTFEEYADLRLTAPEGVDEAFHRAVEMEREETFPMSARSASSHLRSRGYDCKQAMLDVLVTNGVVTLSEPGVWTQTDVDTAAEYFEDCEFYVPYATMCQTLGCRYVDFLRPLREASECASLKYGRHVPESDQYFVMHRVPPRGVTDDNGELVDVTSSTISFTLCDDVRERLELGEEV